MQTFSIRRPAVRSPHGLVAAQNRHAAEAGAAVLARGGNAMDAAIVTALVARYGWADLGARIPIRCFIADPSIASSLKFLRKTPWAREKVESLYLFMLRDDRRAQSARNGPA